MHIRTAGTGIGLSASIAAGAVVALMPQSSTIAEIILAGSILLFLVCVIWWGTDKFYAKLDATQRFLLSFGYGVAAGIYLMTCLYIEVPFRSLLSSQDTELYLQFSDQHSIPSKVKDVNVKYWYALYTESINVNMLDVNKNPAGGFSVPPRWTIFLIFEKNALFHQLVASCRGHGAPVCAVVAANRSYAVITIGGDVTYSTVDILSLH